MLLICCRASPLLPRTCCVCLPFAAATVSDNPPRQAKHTVVVSGVLFLFRFWVIVAASLATYLRPVANARLVRATLLQNKAAAAQFVPLYGNPQAGDNASCSPTAGNTNSITAVQRTPAPPNYRLFNGVLVSCQVVPLSNLFVVMAVQ